MAFRTVVIKNRAKLEYKLGYLIVRGEKEQRIHLSEIDTLIVETTAAAITAALLCELVKNNINVIFCEEKHLPHFYLTPLSNNYISSKNVLLQTEWTVLRKREAWTAIIKNKILLQASLLKKYELFDEADMLNGYISELKSGDETNREGHAAKVYFNALFGNDFSRRSDHLINGKLNYGYAILLSAVSREITAAGYITQIGIWHRNEFNPYNLASDLMEPFRIIVDDFVINQPDDGGTHSKSMPAVMLVQVNIKNQLHFLESALRHYVRSVLRFMDGSAADIPFISEYELNYEL